MSDKHRTADGEFSDSEDEGDRRRDRRSWAESRNGGRSEGTPSNGRVGSGSLNGSGNGKGKGRDGTPISSPAVNGAWRANEVKMDEKGVSGDVNGASSGEPAPAVGEGVRLDDSKSGDQMVVDVDISSVPAVEGPEATLPESHTQPDTVSVPPADVDGVTKGKEEGESSESEAGPAAMEVDSLP